MLVAALLILVFFSGWFGFSFFIRSDLFREWLSKKVSHTLRVDGHFEPLAWEGSTFRSSGFTGIGTPQSKLRSIHIPKISAHFDWPQLLKGTWAVDHVSAEEIEAVLGKNPVETPPPAPGSATQPSALHLPGFLPSEFRIEQLYVASTDIRWEMNHGEAGQLVGTKITAGRKGPDEWEITAVGGSVRQGAYPPVQIDSIHAGLSENSIVIRQAKTLVLGGGEIQVVGEVSTRQSLPARLTADYSGLEATQILPPEWQIGGKTSGHLVYTGDLDRLEQGEVVGSIKIAGAAIDMTNLFVTLHQLAKFGGLNDVRIDSIDTHLKYHDHELELSDFRASYQDQIRVEGAGTITPERLDGSLLIGLSPKILGWIPGAQERVFTEERDGLRWATVNISGTPDQPKEDLTRRLISAFRDKMTQEFKGQAKDAAKSLLDMFHQ